MTFWLKKKWEFNPFQRFFRRGLRKLYDNCVEGGVQQNSPICTPGNSHQFRGTGIPKATWINDKKKRPQMVGGWKFSGPFSLTPFFCQQKFPSTSIHPSIFPDVLRVDFRFYRINWNTARLVETHRSFPGDDTPILRNWWGNQIRQPAGMVETCLFRIELGYDVSSWGCLRTL